MSSKNTMPVLASISISTVFFLLFIFLGETNGNYHSTNGGGHNGGGHSGGIITGGYGYQGSGGYQEKKYLYVPAPPGDIPHCAKNGATYCEKVDTYPTELISYLLYKWGRTYQQFISSETDSPYVPGVAKEYGPSPLPYDSYYPKDNGNGYLPPPARHNASVSGGYDNNNNNHHNNKQYVDSYFRKRQPTGYDYSYSIPQGQGASHSHNNYATTMTAAAAALPPLLHSVWWNHRDPNSGSEAFPHLRQYNREGWGQRWRRRAKRQAENQLCPTTTSYVSPQAAMNMEGNWMYVVNMENSVQYRQLVKTEICANGDRSPCNNVCSVAPGLTATCRQKHVQKRLVALDGSGTSLRGDIFWFAHCCECEIS